MRDPDLQARGLRRAGGAFASLGAMLAAALAPKCPLCVAAALSAIGLGGAGALHLAPFLRPLGIALAVVIGASLVWAERRRAHCKCRVMGHGVEKRAKV